MPDEPVYWSMSRTIERIDGAECHSCGATCSCSRIVKRYTCPICDGETVAPYPFCPHCGYHIDTGRGGEDNGNG